MNPPNYISPHFQKVHYPSSSIRDFRAAEGLNGGQVGDPVELVNVTKTEYMYKFNGQEFQDELGLNWYKYRYRNYDPTFARFFGVDPISEDFYNISTYQFAHNNPVWKIELEGLEGQEVSGQDTQTALGKVWSVVESGMEWVNENINPLTPIVETITGTSYSSGWTEEKPRLQSASEAGMSLIPGGKALGTGEKIIAKNISKKAATLEANKAAGKEFEKAVRKGLEDKGRKEIAEQVTIKADNGVKTRIDFTSKDAKGNIKLTEAKTSEKAPLTKNQKSAFPSIEKSGGTVVGKGKPGLEGGTKIPPTKVEVVRPEINKL